MRITNAAAGGTNPKNLNNTSGIIVAGSITRDFLDTLVATAFASQVGDNFGDTYDAVLTLTLTRGAVVTAISLNRIRWIDPDPDRPDDNQSRITQPVEFRCLGKDTGSGVSEPITITPPS